MCLRVDQVGESQVIRTVGGGRFAVAVRRDGRIGRIDRIDRIDREAQAEAWSRRVW